MSNPFPGFVWPVPAYRSYGKLKLPVVSSAYQATAAEGPRNKPHLGVDILFRNTRAQAPNPPHNSKWFHVPKDFPAIACGPGKVGKVDRGSVGWKVRIDHTGHAHERVVSYYAHLYSVDVEPGERVQPGQKIGIIGDDPSNASDPRHLHFETWFVERGSGRTTGWAIDPEAHFLAFCAVVDTDGNQVKGAGSGRTPVARGQDDGGTYSGLAMAMGPEFTLLG